MAKGIDAVNCSGVNDSTRLLALAKFSSYQVRRSAGVVTVSGILASSRLNFPLATPCMKKHSLLAMWDANSKAVLAFSSGFHWVLSAGIASITRRVVLCSFRICGSRISLRRKVACSGVINEIYHLLKV